MSHFAERVRAREQAKAAADAEAVAKHPLRQKVLGFDFTSNRTRVRVHRRLYEEKKDEKPNYITECVVCGRRNKMTARWCHNCRVNNPIMSGVVTTESVAARAEAYHLDTVRSFVNGMSKKQLFGWVDRAQLVIQGLRLSQVAHMYSRFRQVFNVQNKIELMERPMHELIALLPPEAFEHDDFTQQVVHAAMDAFVADGLQISGSSGGGGGGAGAGVQGSAHDSAPNGRPNIDNATTLNVYDMFGGIAIFCSQDPLVERFKFLCKLFSFDDAEDEVGVLTCMHRIASLLGLMLAEGISPTFLCWRRYVCAGVATCVLASLRVCRRSRWMPLIYRFIRRCPRTNFRS